MFVCLSAVFVASKLTSRNEGHLLVAAILPPLLAVFTPCRSFQSGHSDRWFCFDWFTTVCITSDFVRLSQIFIPCLFGKECAGLTVIARIMNPTGIAIMTYVYDMAKHGYRNGKATPEVKAVFLKCAFDWKHRSNRIRVSRRIDTGHRFTASLYPLQTVSFKTVFVWQANMKRIVSFIVQMACDRLTLKQNDTVGSSLCWVSILF